MSGYPLFFDMGYKNYIVNVDEYNKPLDWGKSSGRLYLTDYILGGYTVVNQIETGYRLFSGLFLEPDYDLAPFSCP